jgi:hypothetical protein
MLLPFPVCLLDPEHIYTRTLIHTSHFYPENGGSLTSETSVTLPVYTRGKDPRAQTTTMNQHEYLKLVMQFSNPFHTVLYNLFPFSFSRLSLFWKNKIGLWDHVAVCVCLCIPSPINFWMPEPIFMKLGTYISAPQPISTAYLKNPSHQSVCLYVYPPIVAR